MAFQFKDTRQPLTLEIAGQQFPVQADPDLERKVQAYTQRMADTLAGFIDTMLGAGATDRIFAGRIRTIEDMSDIVQYIGEEVRKYTV